MRPHQRQRQLRCDSAQVIRRMVENRGHRQYYVRGTFTKFNLDFSKDVEHLNQAGFDQISVEPVVSDPKSALCHYGRISPGI